MFIILNYVLPQFYDILNCELYTDGEDLNSFLVVNLLLDLSVPLTTVTRILNVAGSLYLHNNHYSKTLNLHGAF
jgi:hypothetical protein